MPSPIAQKAVALLSPSVGDFVALAKVKAACSLAKVDVEHLEHKDLVAFAEKLAATCASLGPVVANKIKHRALEL